MPPNTNNETDSYFARRRCGRSQDIERLCAAHNNNNIDIDVTTCSPLHIAHVVLRLVDNCDRDKEPCDRVVRRSCVLDFVDGFDL